MLETQVLKDEKDRPVAVVLDIREYEKLKKAEEDREFFRGALEEQIATGVKVVPSRIAKAVLAEKTDLNRRRIDLFSALSHMVGTGLSIAALVILVVSAAVNGTVWHVVSFSIYGGSMVLLYLTSTLYHWFPYPSAVKDVFRRLDHSMIYLLIAATYTPVCLVPLRGGWGWSLFGVIWALAIWGIVVKAAWLKIPRILSSLSYIFMGWLAVIAFVPLIKTVPWQGLLWLVGGGALYTIGTIFYGRDKKHPSKNWFNYHDLFHLFIIGASFCHFWFMLNYILLIR
jgi:hemolysin III